MIVMTKTAIASFGEGMMTVFKLLVSKLAFPVPVYFVSLFPRPKKPDGSNN